MPSKILARILKPTMKELKEKVDICFDIEERVTKGRKMLGWKFHPYTKKKEKELEAKVPPAMSGKEEKLYNRLIKNGVAESKAKPLAKTIVAKNLQELVPKELYNISISNSDKKISNLGAYLLPFIL